MPTIRAHAEQMNQPPCTPPGQLEEIWVIDYECTVVDGDEAPDDVIVNEGATLTIGFGVGLDINFSEHHLTIKDGGKVLIKEGGKIR